MSTENRNGGNYQGDSPQDGNVTKPPIHIGGAPLRPIPPRDRRRHSRNIQAAVMATVVIICLIIFTIVALNALRANANPPEDSTSEPTSATAPDSSLGDTSDGTTAPVVTTAPPTAPPTVNTTVTTPVQTEPPTTDPPTTAAPFDFEEQYWGDNQASVVKKETHEQTKKTPTVLIYKGKIEGYNTQIIYRFDDDGKLWRGEYLFTTSYSQTDLYRTEYDMLKSAAKKIYGEPTVETREYNTVSAEVISIIGEDKALEFGYLAYTATWKTATTEIVLRLSSDKENGIVVSMTYTKRS